MKALNDSFLQAFWRMLPRRERQAVYSEVVGWRVGSVSPDTGPAPNPIIVVGALRGPSGLGQAARLAVAALRAEGVPHAAIDITTDLLQPLSEPPLDIAGPGPGPGSVLVYATPPNARRALSLVPPSILAGKRRIAGWVCETEKLQPVWAREARSFHHLTAPSRFSARAIAAATGRTVAVLGHPVAAERFDPQAGRQWSGFRIGAMLDVSSSADRKNVAGLAACLAAVARAEFSACFLLKLRMLSTDTRSLDAVEMLRQAAPGRVEIVEADEPRAKANAFYDRIDMMVSLSRAEGFGLPHAEAAARGIMVAAPQWGGPAEFLNAGNSLALPFKLSGIADSSGLYASDLGEWADVEIEPAARMIVDFIRSGRPGRTAPATPPPIFRSDFFTGALLAGEAARPMSQV